VPYRDYTRELACTSTPISNTIFYNIKQNKNEILAISVGNSQSV